MERTDVRDEPVAVRSSAAKASPAVVAGMAMALDGLHQAVRRAGRHGQHLAVGGGAAGAMPRANATAVRRPAIWVRMDHLSMCYGPVERGIMAPVEQPAYDRKTGLILLPRRQRSRLHPGPG